MHAGVSAHRSRHGYDLKRWGDGDDFLVNGIAHPMQGAIAGWIFIQNSPSASRQVMGKDHQYWTTRLKAMAWAAAWEVQWKIGPLGESSIGNAGGWSYVPGCGIQLRCIKNPNYPPATNNTGLSDWIMTPVAGTGWIMIEDLLDKYIVAPVSANHHHYGIVLLSALEPTRDFAAAFAGVLPWNSGWRERHPHHNRPALPRSRAEDTWKKYRHTAGIQFVYLTLPAVTKDCAGCGRGYTGLSLPFTSRLSDHLHFDTETNFFPQGPHNPGPAIQGLYGARFGQQSKNWGLFAKVRPGFIY